MSKLKKFHVPYGMTPNNLLNNKHISLKAKGLFAFMQAKPDDWKFSGKLIAMQCKESLDSILSGLKELEDFGYLEREKKPTAKGFVTTYYLHEYVDSQNHTENEKPRRENPFLGEPRRENPTLENPTLENPSLGKPLDNSNKEESKKEEIKKEKERGQKENFLPPALNEVVEFFKKYNIKASPENFWNHWESVGWKKSRGQQIVKWQSLVPKWEETENTGAPAQKIQPAQKGVNLSPKQKEMRERAFEAFARKTRGFVETLQADASALETARIKFNAICNHPHEFNSQAVYNEISTYQIRLANSPQMVSEDDLYNLTLNQFKINFFNWFKMQKHGTDLFSETPNKAHRPPQLQNN